MAIATGTAIALGILGATQAGTAIYAANRQGAASREASEQQQEGVREARAYAEPLYQDAQRIAREQYERGQAIAAEQHAHAQRIAAEQHAAGQAQFAPYTGAGAGGIAALSKFLGVPSAPPARAAAPSTAPYTGAPMTAAPLPMAPAAAAPAAPSGSVPLTALVNGRGVPASLLASMTTREIAEANRASGGAFLGGRGPTTTSSYAPGAAAPSQSAYVTLRAPTGETRPVPADQVDFFLARGATRI